MAGVPNVPQGEGIFITYPGADPSHSPQTGEIGGGMSSLTPRMKALDKVFSTYIRKRDCKGKDYGRCCTCNILIPYEDGDCGHWQTRDNMSTRWDERNSHFQCRKCNRFLSGCPADYAMFMLHTYGQEVMEELTRNKWIAKKWTDLDIEGMIIDYKEKTKGLLITTT